MYKITDRLSQLVPTTPKERWKINEAAIAIVNQNLDTLTPEQQQTLALYSGMGSVAKIFQSDDQPAWAQHGQAKLKTLINAQAYQVAKESILNAYYTSHDVARGMWSVVQALGFKTGKVLEPTAGNGLFMGLSTENDWTAVESDPTSAAIVSKLYPEATVYNQGFETVSLPDDEFDLVIGNVPFGKIKLQESRYDHLSLSIHNHVIAKSVDKTRPNGLIALITSTGTLDAPSNESFRLWLAQRCNLTLALRLPNNAFKDNAGTEVTADILFLQKRAEPVSLEFLAESKSCPWVVALKAGDAVDANGNRIQTYVSSYYSHVDHRHHALGKFCRCMLYGSPRIGVESNGLNLFTQINEHAQALQPIYQKRSRQITKDSIAIPPSLQSVKVNTFCVWNNDLYIRTESYLKPVDPSVKPKVTDYQGLVDVLLKLLDLQINSTDEPAIAQYRKLLNHTYDQFVAQWGTLNSRAIKAVFEQEPNYCLLKSLENANGKKADVFFQRTASACVPPAHCSTVKEAYLHCLQANGKLSIPWIAQRLNQHQEETIKQLQQEELVYLNPSNGEFLIAEEFLSGNVKQRLQKIKTWLKQSVPTPTEQQFAERAIAALEAVQPLAVLPPATPEIITHCIASMGIELSKLSNQQQDGLFANTLQICFGSNLISAQHYTDFVRWLLLPESERCNASWAYEVRLTYLPSPLHLYCIEVGYQVSAQVSCTTTYGTERMNAIDIIRCGLNQKDPVIYDKIDDKQVVNAVETEQARLKLELIREQFSHWLWQDADRAIEITTAYNTTFNSWRSPQYDGTHLQLIGSNPEIQLKSHQKNVVWRILRSNATLMAHVVGAGKTYSMCAAAMELRRLNLAHKPMIVALNSTVSQLAEQFRDLYPHAKLLIADKASFEKHRRRALLTQIATGDWDAVILAHTQFFALPMSKDSVLKFLQHEKAALEVIQNNTDKMTKGVTKAIAAAQKRIESQICKVAYSPRKDDVIDFERLGVDALFFDESQAVKNLRIVTKQYNIAGIPSSGSERAQDTYMKARYLLEHGKRVIYATGTPVSNTMAELYNLQRTFQLETLEAAGIDHFDAWSSLFGQTQTAPEISPTGKYKVKTRFNRFVNLPELMSLYNQFADVQTTEMLSLPAPKTALEIHAAPCSQEQADYLKVLLERSEAVSKRVVAPEEDNMLTITSDGRKAALEMRLLNPKAENYRLSKVNACAWHLWRIWQASSPAKASQLVFVDLSVPSKENRFTVYRYLKDVLVGLGIPETEIAFVHDHDTPARKKTLFEQVNNGTVRILLGGTQKLGTGVNVQERLIAVHHLDAPWRPSDIEQRDGRIKRQGNLFPKAWIFRYCTEGKTDQCGFDAFLWQTLENKARCFAQVFRGGSINRTVEDVGDATLSYAQVKALASGDPIIIEKAELDNELRSLQLRKQAHDKEQIQIKSEIRQLQKSITSTLPQRIAEVSKDVDALQTYDWDAPEFVVDGEVYNDAKSANKALLELTPELLKLGSTFKVIGEIGHFKLISKPYVLRIRFFLRSAHQEYVVEGDRFGDILDTLQSLPGHLQSLKDSLADEQIRLAHLQQEENKTFAQQSRYAWVSQRVQEIQSLLRQQQEAALSVAPESKDKEEEDDQDWLASHSSAGVYSPPDAEIIGYLLSDVRQPDWLVEIAQLSEQMAQASKDVLEDGQSTSQASKVTPLVVRSRSKSSPKACPVKPSAPESTKIPASATQYRQSYPFLPVAC
jgi:N12 class adenine-specific DNA methylase